MRIQQVSLREKSSMDGLRLIEHCAEFLRKEDVYKVPHRTRGIYVLLWHDPNDPLKKKYEVVYIGMSRRGIMGRLEAHKRSKVKSDLWNYFSVYSVWPNITDEEIEELEGLFRAIYRRDSTANKIAVQKGFRKLGEIRDDKFQWDPLRGSDRKRKKR